MEMNATAPIIANLRNVFAIVLSLSLGEAYKQCVADTAANNGTDWIRWGSVRSLSSFLLLVIPFFQGMARFLDVAYQGHVTPQGYGRHLLFDIFAFTLEASGFFVMSRTLRPQQWRKFYGAIVAILVVDATWAYITVHFRHIPDVAPWMWSNLFFLIALGVILLVCRRKRDTLGQNVALVAMVLRTAADYYFSWSFYFPK